MNDITGEKETVHITSTQAAVAQLLRAYNKGLRDANKLHRKKAGK